MRTRPNSPTASVLTTFTGDDDPSPPAEQHDGITFVGMKRLKNNRKPLRRQGVPQTDPDFVAATELYSITFSWNRKQK